jgi:flavin-dependent dehydrogenase
LNNFDVLIIGGGVAGATAALTLARAGWSVAVAEKSTFPRRKVCGEYLSPTNLSLFARLGILDDFLQNAGPEITSVGLYYKEIETVAPMPSLNVATPLWGRAVRRAILDPLLLRRAAEAGASCWQPWTVTGLHQCGGYYASELISKSAGDSVLIKSRAVIAAHGSWEVGTLPTELRRSNPSNSDLFGFKVHFSNSSLPQSLMPLIVFPGGYGGMVNCGDGLVSLSFCVRRDVMNRVRNKRQGAGAGEALLDHIMEFCAGVRKVLSCAVQHDVWASAGPIKPGIRDRVKNGVFCVGNAAGEAHPIIAEGISIAMQSAWLLTRRLIAAGPDSLTGPKLKQLEREYSKAWLKAFGLRIRTAEVAARLALTNNIAHRLCLPVLLTLPRILTFGALLSGKASPMENPDSTMRSEAGK